VCVQGLLTETPFEYPRHRSTGVPLDRMLMVLAVLGRHTRARASRGYDVFVNVVGGLKLSDPGGGSYDVAAANCEPLPLSGQLIDVGGRYSRLSSTPS